MKNIAILGSTGSIGTQALDVISAHPDRFAVKALACGRNITLLSAQIKRFHPDLVSVQRQEDALALSKAHPGVEILYGEEGLAAVAACGCDMVLNALMGMRGLVPTCRAIEAGRDIALANKETLVAGGELVMEAVKRRGVRLLPVDSEHSAIFQCLEGNRGREIRRILLTASGGPFRGYTKGQLAEVTLAQALRHPKWSMGKKITIDSATMMNKGLEVIEARWLFDVPLSAIQILVHPQSIIHSAVEFADTAVIAQLGLPDMRIPISLALGYPDRLASESRSLDFFREGASLTFEEPDTEVFGCVRLAYEAAEAGGSYPVVLNAANEVLVEQFLAGRIQFADIERKLERILDAHNPTYNLTLDDVLDVDRRIRSEVL